MANKQRSNKETVALCISLTLVFCLFGVVVYFNYGHSSPAVLKLEPFFWNEYNDLEGDGTPFRINGEAAVKVWPVGDGHRYILYGNIIELEEGEIYCIEGTYTHNYQAVSVGKWIRVDRMYPYRYCLDENGFVQQFPFKGELPQ